jgi:hypothetical protein
MAEISATAKPSSDADILSGRPSPAPSDRTKRDIASQVEGAATGGSGGVFSGSRDNGGSRSWAV